MKFTKPDFFALVVVGVNGAILGGVLLLNAIPSPFGYPRVTHTQDADEFHASETSQYLDLPRSARLQRIKKTDIWPDAYQYEFWFELPESRTADDWVRSIWASNRFAPRSCQGVAHYGAYHTGENIHDDVSGNSRISSLHRGQRTLVYLAQEKRYYALVVVPYPGREAGW